MLTLCPECALQVSDKAISCPHCGYPLETGVQIHPRPARTKRMRLPNGFGSIDELKQDLRKPYRAMVTVGFDSNGKLIRRTLKPQGYFKTYNDAYAALVEYHKNPYDLDSDITVKELYNKWSEEYFKSLTSLTSVRTIKSAWNYCNSLHKIRVKDLRARHIKDCMENGFVVRNGVTHKPSPAIKSRIKSLFNLMLDYAVEYEIADKNYARTFDVSTKILEDAEELKNAHIPFTDSEINLLWENINVPYVDLILIQCYSGWRPQELGLLKVENIDWTNKTMTGGMKTKAGKGRLVPIHPKIEAFIKKYYDEAIEYNSEYLFNCLDSKNYSSRKLTYDKYAYRFGKVVEYLKLNSDHRPHDPRKHFVTLAKRYNVNEYAIKYIVGHSINDLTEAVYTERTTDWLITEMKKIK